jgi:hypothetical protein
MGASASVSGEGEDAAPIFIGWDTAERQGALDEIRVEIEVGGHV